ncbi:NarL family two-component system response regulator LiaR [Salibacterium salarium]|uniref:response regulator transcription factor n=1 Tax=Salibacterium salarium TaxID=284579 RepID=UPI002784548B|nr:response regulator transcription factor [Salibacterium salarium]MDQ0299858.1 NarL family two-component system response regulator LiaR [Salibacterium salarium]
MINVLLIDDHVMVRIGMSAYLSTETDIEVVGEADNGESGLELIKKHQPDVVLMDLIMEKMDGVETTEKINSQYPQIKVIVLTSFYDDEQVYPAIEAGAFSYLLKTSKAQTIAQAIRAAVKGESMVEAAVTKKMMQRMRGTEQSLHETLTDRELDVVTLIGNGKTNQEIANELFIGIKTVKTHVSHILSKLGVDDRTQIAIYAHRHGLAT